MRLIDSSVHPFFRSNAEIHDYLNPSFKTRGLPDVELLWYQAPGGDYHESLYQTHYPGSDPETASAHIFDEMGCDIAILNPLTRGNLPDRLLNSAVCAATNDWLAERWLDKGNSHGKFRGTIRVNPEDPSGAIREIERWADNPLMVQIGVPLQSREPYGKPQFIPIWQAAAQHRLPVAVHLTGGAGIDHAPTPAGHARTYPNFAAFVPLNYFSHLASIIIEGLFEQIPNLLFVFADGGLDILTPLIWRLDNFWRPLRDQTPWVKSLPSHYLKAHVRFCLSKLEGPFDPEMAEAWFDQMGKSDLLMFASDYPYWSWAKPADLPAGISASQRDKILWRNAADLYRFHRPTPDVQERPER